MKHQQKEKFASKNIGVKSKSPQKIVILGTGNISISLAKFLSAEFEYLTIVDNNESALRVVKEELDVATLNGYPASPRVLLEAGVDKNCILVAATENDELNLAACSVAKLVLKAKTTICRLRSTIYEELEVEFESSTSNSVDQVFHPEAEVMEFIHRLLEYPGTNEVLSFAEGQVSVVGLQIPQNSPMIGVNLQTLRRDFGDVYLRIAVIHRNKNQINADGDTVLQQDDYLLFLTATATVHEVMKKFFVDYSVPKKVVIGGGGNIGKLLAQKLNQNPSKIVKIIEQSEARCKELSPELFNSLVICGEICDRDLMLAENVGNSDVYCAVSNSDEANLMSCLLAKSLDINEVIALVNKPGYTDILTKYDIDVTVLPSLISANSLWQKIKVGNLSSIYALRYESTSMVEFEINKYHWKLINCKLGEVKLPDNAIVIGIVRALGEIVEPKKSEILREKDRVIIYLGDSTLSSKIEELVEERHTDQ